jgi:diamine N-acetyltransferase
LLFFESEKVYLRTLEPTDIDILYRWENNVSLWQLSNTHKPFSKHVLQSFIDEAYFDIYTNKNLRLIICNINHVAIGAIDLFDFEPFHLRAGVGILIADEESRKQGFANDALSITINYAKDILLLNQLYCNINSNNVESIKLFMRNGFEITGNKKAWNKSKDGFVDELFLQLMLNIK